MKNLLLENYNSMQKNESFKEKCELESTLNEKIKNVKESGIMLFDV